MRSNRATDRLPGRGRRCRDESPRRGVLSAALIGAVLVSALPALAVHQISTEEDSADLLATPVISLEEAEEPSKERQWAIIPEVGYDPESGGLGGAKFTHRNVAGTGPRSTSRRPTHGTARRA